MNYIKYCILFALCLATFGLMAQMTTEEKVIKQVIEDETQLFYQRDYDAWASKWAHSPSVYVSITGPETHISALGWEELSAQVKEEFSKNPDPIDRKPEKTDYNFMVKENMAFVTFKEDGDMSTRVLKKHDGVWKVLNVGVVQTGAYQAQKHMKALKGLTGVWELDPTSVELSDEKWSLTDAKCKVKETSTGVKMYITSDWKRADGFTGTWNDAIVVARDSESDKMGVMISTDGPYGTSVHTGECYVKDDYIAFKAYKLGTENLMKQKLVRVDDNTLKMHYKFMNADGEVEWKMGFALVKNQEESLAMN